MKKSTIIVLLLIATKISGTFVSANPGTKISEVTNSNDQAASEQSIEKELKTDASGANLSIKYKCLNRDESDEAKSAVLPSGQMLVGVCNALFLLDTNKNVVWEYNVPQILLDFVFIPSTGLVYGTAGDNNMFILEASTGKELIRNSRNGSAGYGRVKPYLNDICLVTDNNWGYRHRLNDPSIEDGVTAWRETEVLWRTELPPGAELIVNGSRILALTKTKDGIFIKDIVIPEGKSR